MKKKVISIVRSFFTKIFHFIRTHKFYALIMLIYTFIGVGILLSHEPWRDEAQAWLIGRDLSFFGMIRQMYFEGHPCLWSFLLSFFAKFHFPYFTLNIISFLFMWISAFLILVYSPFSLIGKILIIFSFPFMYSYSVIARSYCLIPLSLILIALQYPTRHEHPFRYSLFVLFLAWTHVVMLGLVGILLAFFYGEELFLWKNKTKADKKVVLKSLGIVIFFLLLFILPIGLGARNNNLVINDTRESRESFYITRSLCYFIFGHANNRDILILLLLFIVAFFYEFRFYKKNFVMLIASFLFQGIVYYLFYFMSYQRAETFIFIFIFFLWIQAKDRKCISQEKNFDEIVLRFIVYGILLSLLISYSITMSNYIKRDLKYSFSDSKKAAAFIRKNAPKNSLFITTDMPATEAMIPYFPKSLNYQFYGLENHAFFTFVTWNYQFQYFFDDYVLKLVREKFCNYDHIYIICPCSGSSCYTFPQLAGDEDILLVYSSEQGDNEMYTIYEVAEKNLHVC